MTQAARVRTHNVIRVLFCNDSTLSSMWLVFLDVMLSMMSVKPSVSN